MTASVSVCFLLILAAFSNASLLDADIARHFGRLSQKRFTRSLDAHPRSFPKSENNLASLFGGRKLMQGTEASCFFDDEDEVCEVSATTALALLQEVDTPLSNYLHDLIRCGRASDETECGTDDCHWNGEFCDPSHESAQALFSSDCFGEALHLAELRLIQIECEQTTEADICQADEQCTWDDEDGECFRDEWMYFHGIPSEGIFPSGFTDTFGELADQILAEAEAAVDRGDLDVPSDFLNIDISFECPSGTEQVVCDYVEAFTPYFLTDLYCDAAYPDAADLIECETDPSCEPDSTNPESPCRGAASVFSDAFRTAEEAFTSNIEDPEAREYMELRAVCAFMEEESGCIGDCIWDAASDRCRLHPDWAEREVTRLGDMDDPVCQYYASDTITGCIDNTDEASCTADDSCFWRTSSNSCSATMFENLAIAFAGTSVEDDYEAARDQCSASSAAECT